MRIIIIIMKEKSLPVRISRGGKMKMLLLLLLVEEEGAGEAGEALLLLLLLADPTSTLSATDLSLYHLDSSGCLPAKWH